MVHFSTPRAARQTFGGGEPVFLADPETGQPVVYSTVVAGAAGSANGAVLFDVDLSGVITLLVQMTGTWVGQVVFETTVDGANWFSLAGFRPDGPSAVPVSSTSSNVPLVFSAIGRRFRARMSAYTSGVVYTSVCLSDVPVATLGYPAPGAMTISAGTNLMGKVNVAPATSGGTTGARILAASGVIKGSAGMVFAYDLLNTNAAARYLQLYAKTSAGVPGTDTPSRTLPFAGGLAKTWENINGAALASGISYAITTDAAGTTLAAAGDIVGTVEYA